MNDEDQRLKAESENRSTGESANSQSRRLAASTFRRLTGSSVALSFVTRHSALSIWHLVTVIALALVPFLRAGATNEAELTLRPPHELLPPTFWEQHGWTVVLGSLGLVLVIGIIVWLLCRPRPPIIVPPEVVARRELLALQPKPEDGAVVSQATQVLRRYIAAAFELSPNEFTTAEFCRLLAGEERIGNELAAALGEFLRDCDERKFNPHPEQPPASGVVARALQLLDQAQARRALVQERDALAASQTPMPARA